MEPVETLMQARAYRETANTLRVALERRPVPAVCDCLCHDPGTFMMHAVACCEYPYDERGRGVVHDWGEWMFSVTRRQRQWRGVAYVLTPNGWAVVERG